MRIALLKGGQALESMAEGAQQLMDTVGTTLGPAARASVILTNDFRHRQGWSNLGSLFTKDGAELSENFTVQDPFQQAAIGLIREAATQTQAMVGDGTTATVILAASIFIEAAKLVAAGHVPIAVVKGIRRGALKAARFVSALHSN